MTATPTPVHSLFGVLREMRSMIEHLDDESYAAPAPGRSSGGIGGHVRHCLDHVGALIAALRTGTCAYDRRIRGTDVETNRRAALHRLAEVEGALSRLGSAALETVIDVETQLDPDGSMVVTTSTLGRELIFVTSHTIHHNAIVAYLLDGLGLDVEPRFGLAPATPSPVAPLTCAR